jgi:hypothetical protein
MKQKRDDYRTALLFMLTLALLSAFAGLIPLWEAQLRGSVDSFFPIFSVIYVLNALVILLAMFEWRRAAILLAATWLTTIGVNFYLLPEMQLLSPIIGIILMAFFLDEIYTRWRSQFKRWAYEDESTIFAEMNTQLQADDNIGIQKLDSRLERLSDVIDNETFVASEQEEQSSNRQL